MEIIKVSGQDALKVIDQYRATFSVSSQLYPFVIGTDTEVDALRGMLSPPADGGAAILEQAAAFNVVAWLKDHEPKGGKSWPAKLLSPQRTIHSLWELSSNTRKPEVNIGLVAVGNSWEIFAALGYGDWNDCPSPHIHVALHQYWASRFKASPLALGSDVVECLVGVPPKEKSGALALAREQYTYCPDVVDQGVGSISKLASSLLESKLWYFWWD